ncbi:MAG: ribonuclease III [Clostridiales bacterium]|jgi:ribonuclease-3 family protein|uniref:Mini-ribonuclease 3 n=1 Tax=Candidatus Limivicinus sp. TaxID=3030905 RepID=UPI000D7A149C|nr:ribonuclease III domain-containing protein [Oscillospiraceae bacterium]PWL75200.1 MAG: ribonuclease III [Clostridiales bacterium]
MYGFFPEMPVQDVNKISMLGLAHVGDAVYELLYRSKLCTDGHTAVAEMHRMTVAFVRAEAQAEAAAKLLPVLTQDETSVFKRGRNAKVNSVPHNADIGQYHAATGLEALFGWLYLLGRTERINELFNIITGGADDAS